MQEDGLLARHIRQRIQHFQHIRIIIHSGRDDHRFAESSQLLQELGVIPLTRTNFDRRNIQFRQPGNTTLVMSRRHEKQPLVIACALEFPTFIQGQIAGPQPLAPLRQVFSEQLIDVKQLGLEHVGA